TRSGLAPFRMFEFTRPGLWFCLAALLFLCVVPPIVLRRKGAFVREPLPARSHIHHYLAELEIVAGSPLAGRRSAEVDLETFLDVQVLQIMREGGRCSLPIRSRLF